MHVASVLHSGSLTTECDCLFCFPMLAACVHDQVMHEYTAAQENLKASSQEGFLGMLRTRHMMHGSVLKLGADTFRACVLGFRARQGIGQVRQCPACPRDAQGHSILKGLTYDLVKIRLRSDRCDPQHDPTKQHDKVGKDALPIVSGRLKRCAVRIRNPELLKDGASKDVRAAEQKAAHNSMEYLDIHGRQLRGDKLKHDEIATLADDSIPAALENLKRFVPLAVHAMWSLVIEHEEQVRDAASLWSAVAALFRGAIQRDVVAVTRVIPASSIPHMRKALDALVQG
jgi:hypothetical protein